LLAKTAPKKNLSSLKRVRQSEKKRLRNQSVKTKIKTQITKLASALQSQNRDVANTILKETEKIIRGAVSKNVIHKNAASRKISRITRKVNALKVKESVSKPPAQAEVS
jgi:small subunit ribosomal protein S20